MDPSGRYEDLVTVSAFVPHYHLAGGVNLPKIIDCVGSDGIRRKQLVKVGARVAVLEARSFQASVSIGTVLTAARVGGVSGSGS